MALYVSPVPGHVVSRFGTATRTTNNVPIGYLRDTKTGAFEMVSPEIVVMIPDAEEQRFSREYEGAIREGALKRRDEAAFKAWLEALKVARKELAAKVDANEKKKAADAAAAKTEQGAAPTP